MHFILQGKGGVGKSMIASLLYQGLEFIGKTVFAYDTDPVNATLSSYKSFKVTRLDLLALDGNIDTRKFDELLQGLADADEEAHVIIDNGASSFISLMTYIKENEMLEALEELGHTVFFHTIITGGQSISDTLEGFVNLVYNFPQSNLVVWINSFFGSVEVDGKSYQDFKCFKENLEHVHAFIQLPIGNKDLIGKDLEQLFAKRQPFEVGINSSNNIAVRSRLKKYWKTVVSYIEQANIC